KAVDARKAQKIGLVDKVVHSSILEEQAIAFAQSLIAEGKGKRRKQYAPAKPMDKILDSALGRPVVFGQAKKMVLKQTHGHYPAPLKALEVIKKTYGMRDRAAALAAEADGFCEVAVTDVSRNLINVFFMMESVKKKTGVNGDVKPLPTRAIGVLGAGTMGGGIAYVGADKGIDVRMKDISNDALAKGFEHARGIWEKLLKKRKITHYELTQKMNRVTGGLDYSGFGQLDVVIEAIVEDMKIKQKVIGETAAKCKPDCIIATNTSSLSVSEMSKGHPNPANFVGMHFFNPVDKMPLVEVIRGAATSDVAVATIFELSKKMGKVPVVVKDGPGFIVNRLLVPYLLEAMFLMEDGMSIETVDDAYVKEFGMPMGPFRLIDEVGLDVCVKVAKIFHESLGARIELPPALAKFGATGRLGKKNGRGFYKYDERGKSQGVDEAIYGELGLGTPTNKLKSSEVIERGIFTMINEASLALIEERIVESPEEVDLAMIMGTGFPPFRGGLLRYADTVGTKNIADALERFAVQYGARFKSSKPLANMAKTDRRFY
ncbi:MAG: 3-hydroxyacyl-CoA dehydrogenase NAD-binding domain-containing protein, partial [Bdellovibrionaceae bacterium]|nr:3-hydroxyacyl-CoA dehydrogenase NAD-binding domain-containing protein [Pseudobdellovibrionaceae bacterium]